MKPEIDSILLANWYFTKCKIDDPKCKKTELARQYLTAVIKRTLFERKSNKENNQTKFFFNFN